MMADRSLAIFTPHGCIDTRNTPADSYLITFIPAGSIGDTSGSWMVADKLLTIFTPSDYLHTIKNTDASIRMHRGNTDTC